MNIYVHLLGTHIVPSFKDTKENETKVSLSETPLRVRKKRLRERLLKNDLINYCDVCITLRVTFRHKK